MRFALLLSLVACQPQLDASIGGDGSGSGSGSDDAPSECRTDSDCTPAGTTCCACPTFAVPVTDPTERACGTVACPPSTCSANVRPACSNGACVLACVAMTCSTSCGDGYAMDSNGCLTCDCDQVATPACMADGDCVRVPADCCGCEHGGADTAIPAADQAPYDASLGCSPNPSCPSTNTCAPDLAPTCVQGSCELVAALPPNACGRPDLPACPDGQVCTINASDPATAQGVGVCM